MQYLEFSLADSGRILFNAFSKQFDTQDDFSASTISFSLDRTDPLNGELSGSFIKVKVDGKSLKTYFLISGNTVDYVTESGIPARAYNGSSIHTEFEDASVLPSAWPNPTPSGHDFQNATPGNIVKTLIARVQEFGFLTNINTDSFTGTHDSNGVTWTAMMDRSYSTGDTILSVVQGLFSDGSCDAEMDQLSLNLYVSGTLDKTVTPDKVVLRVGQNLTDGSTQVDSSEFYTDIFAIGDGDAAVMKTRPASYNTIGRRRMRFAQYGGISNEALLGVMADIELDQYNHVKYEHSYAVSPDFYTPFIDYDVHNLVPLDKGDGVIENIRIKQISVTQNDADGSFSIGVTLGDLLEDADEKLKRRLDAITGANAGGGAVPSDKNDDKNPPQWPASVTISSLSYLDASTNPKVAALVDWPDVTTNSDGTPANDIDHYEVQYRTATTTAGITSASYGPVSTSEESKAYFSGFEAGTVIQVQARTVDSSGLVSPQWTQSVATTLVRTGSTLVAPSTPAVTSMFQGVRGIWDGLDSNGSTPTGEWLGVAVHASSTGSTFTPNSTNKMDFLDIIGGQLVSKTFALTGLTPATTYWIKLVAVGRGGGVSPASTPVSVTTGQVVSADLTPKLIDAAKYIQDSTVNTAQLNVATFSEQIIPNAGFEGGYTGAIPDTWVQTDIYTGSGNSNPAIVTGTGAMSGNVSWQHTVAPGDSRIWRSAIVPLTAGDVYYFAGMIKTSRLLATPNSITISLAYGPDSNPSTFSSANIGSRFQLPITAFQGATTGIKVEGQLSVPNNMFFGCIFIRVGADTGAATNVTATFDDIQLKRVVGTANIANAAINNAQIHNLAVDDAKISNMSVGKLVTGTLTADMTISSRIKTANTGARVELNAAGVQGYNSSGDIVTQLTTDGGLISKYFRTNTSGTRIEMGTYATDAGSANIAFFPDSRSWQFPPGMGFGGAYTSNWIPGIAMFSGSLSDTNYGKYGLSQIGLDQVGGIGLSTGNKLDGSEGSVGANININAGGDTAKVIIRGGRSDRASLVLDADATTSSTSKLTLPYGGISFNGGGSYSNSLYRSTIGWAGWPADHMVLGAGNGLRMTSYNQTDLLFGIDTSGIISTTATNSAAKIKTSSGFSNYAIFTNSGDVWVNGSKAKTFVIDHPDKPDNYLVHATNEMPEARVDYTGNGKLEPAKKLMGPETTNFSSDYIGENDVEIELPPYFKSLVDERAPTTVVMVSPYYDDCDESCEYHGTPSIAATRIKDGKFRVKATGGYYHPCISFAWRVSAVRKDIAPLEVEPLKSDTERRGDGPYTYTVKKA